MSLSQWQSTLAENGVVFEDGKVIGFGEQTPTITPDTNVMCDLSHLATLSVAGDDAASFLQGQFTNDINALSTAQAQLTGYCNPKGRLLALFLAFMRNETIHLQLPSEISQAIQKRLTMFVMRSKVTIAPEEDLISIGVSGPNVNTILADIGTLPTEHFAQTNHQDFSMIKLPSEQAAIPRYQIMGTIDAITTIWQTLSQNCTLAGYAVWEALAVKAGEPSITKQTQEQFVPQMVNLDVLNAINFKKGCYTGQEIVARTHYLGTVKRRSYYATIAMDNTNKQPTAGDKLFNVAGNEVGQLVRVGNTNQTETEVLAELRTEAHAEGSITWEQQALTFKLLPYSLEVE